MPTITLPGLDADLQKLSEEFTKTQSAWRVILHNDNYNTMENVVLWLQKATGCSLEQAEHITYVAHTTGKAVCYSGNKEKCVQVGGYLSGRGLRVDVEAGP